ncbi:MAG: hypothetical protein AUJ86_00140 [Hydrogenophilaceae bacterium CG1_02_62_390]|nr:MAG: hypothetical protein AUJ86_00140 [Hydrogenophilaceae bacterium CG1_02_62_390]
MCGAGNAAHKKSQPEGWLFSASNELLGGSSRSSGISRSSSVSRSGSSRGFGRSRGRSSRFGSGGGSSRFFFLATSGQTQGQQGGEQDGIFHLSFLNKS